MHVWSDMGKSIRDFITLFPVCSKEKDFRLTDSKGAICQYLRGNLVAFTLIHMDLLVFQVNLGILSVNCSG